MQFSVRVTGDMEHKLLSTINAMHKSRNAIINEALEFYLDNLNLEAVEKETAEKIKALNAADKVDDLSEMGDYL
jgi:predicted transcriptional regulator